MHLPLECPQRLKPAGCEQIVEPRSSPVDTQVLEDQHAIGLVCAKQARCRRATAGRFAGLGYVIEIDQWRHVGMQNLGVATALLAADPKAGPLGRQSRRRGHALRHVLDLGVCREPARCQCAAQALGQVVGI